MNSDIDNKIFELQKQIDLLKKQKKDNKEKIIIDNTIPNEYLCPISKRIMEYPVICEDGYIYDKQSILSLKNNINPITEKNFTKNFIRNRGLEERIYKFKTGSKKRKASRERRYPEKEDTLPEIKYDYTYLLMKTCFININNYDKNLLIKIGKFIDDDVIPNWGHGISKSELKRIYDTLYNDIFEKKNIFDKQDVSIDDFLNKYINITDKIKFVPTPGISDNGRQYEYDSFRLKFNFISNIVSGRKFNGKENTVQDINLFFKDKEKIIYSRMINLFYNFSCCYTFIKDNGKCLIYIITGGGLYFENYKIIDITLSDHILNIISGTLSLIDKEKNYIVGCGDKPNEYKEFRIMNFLIPYLENNSVFINLKKKIKGGSF
jgi:hypothetical protein